MGKPNVPLITEPTMFSILQPAWLPDYGPVRSSWWWS